MKLRLEIDCYWLVLVTCDGEEVGVITPGVGRQTVEVPFETGQQLALHSDLPYTLYSTHILYPGYVLYPSEGEGNA